MKKLLVVLVVFLCGCGIDGSMEYPNSRSISLEHVTYEEMQALAYSKWGDAAAKWRVLGYYYLNDEGGCKITVVHKEELEAIKPGTYHSTLGHELDHCAGWTHTDITDPRYGDDPTVHIK